MTTTVDQGLLGQAKAVKTASRLLAKVGTEAKNRALLNIAQALQAREKEVLAANDQDYQEGKRNGLGEEVLDKLLLNSTRIASMIQGVRSIVSLPDPIGESFDSRVLPNGLEIARRRVPLGVVAVIYEARPDVSVDIPSLCLKAGNGVILRGGKEAFNSNLTLSNLVRGAIAEAGLPADSVQFVASTDRALVGELLRMREQIDLVVPRGGTGLIQYVADHATMATITGGRGVCHMYVDRTADPAMASAIAVSDKVRRPAACNSLDGLLVHREIAERALPLVAAEMAKESVELRCDPESLAILERAGAGNIRPASQEDWGKEFLALVAAVKVMNGLEEAIEHIDRYGSGHSEVIVTEDYSAARRFVNEVDASAVLVNAGMGFNDGAQLGLGAEVVTSTNKFHARGPIGLRELTSYKWTVYGQGQVRR